MATIITYPKGAKGTNGANPGTGTNGTDAIFTQNGKIGADALTVQATGGEGGDGGDNSGAALGGTGGKGGNAAITLNGNIFNAPATTSLVVSLTATGGNGGNGGAGTPPGAQGVGGNGTVTVNGNIIQPNKAMTNIELDAIAQGGNGAKKGNASATLNGNIVQPSKGATSVTLKAVASNLSDDVSHDGDLSYGTKTATLNGNIVQGNIPTVTLIADAFPSNGTANVNGNIVQVSSNTAVGTAVTLEASGNHIAITNNKITLGKHTFNLTINEYAAGTVPHYDATIKDNEFKGSGSNLFVFTDNALPGPHKDTVSVNLGAGTFTFNGNSNLLTGFNAVSIQGSGVNATLTGGPGNDTLIGGDGDDVLIGGGGDDILRGKGGNDTLDGGDGNDQLFGGDGDDTLLVSSGIDLLDGMTDPLGDTASFINAGSYDNDGITGVTATANATNVPLQEDFIHNFNGVTSKTTFVNIQNLTGSNFNDTLIGDAANNTLSGGQGNDTLTGGAGDDILDGGAGTGDVARYSGNYQGNGYTISPIVGGPTPGIIVADNTPGRDGTDQVFNVETLLFNDGSYNVATATFTPNGPVNHAPVATITPLTYSATEQTGLDLKNSMSVSDSDAGAGNVTATLSVTEGTLNVAAGTSGVVVTNSGTSAVTLNGTLAQINDLLNTNATSTVSYIDNTDTPSATSTLTLLVNDNGNTGPGGAMTGSDTATINITAVNDAPTATITPLTYSATEQTALSLKNNGLSVADPDAGAGSVRVTLSVTEGTLTIGTGTSGATVFSGNGTSSVVVDGTLAQINDLLNTNATSTVSYIDNTDTPSASATLTLAINDNGNTGTGGALTGSDTATINITAVNDAPTATITPLSYSATEQTGLDLKNSMSVADPDAGAGSVRVTLSVTEGTLTIGTGTSGATVFSGNGTSSVVVDGTLAQINDLLNTNATSTVSYIDNTDTPSASATLTLSVNDNGNTGTGGALTGSDTATINITAVNDAPTATITPASYAVTETVPLSLKNNGLAVADVDAGTGSVRVTLSATEGTLTIGTGTSGATVFSGNGTGSVVLDGTLAQINDLLNTNATSTVSYVDNVNTPAHTATLTLAINDNGNTGTGGALTGQDTATLNIAGSNTAPTLDASKTPVLATEGENGGAPSGAVGTLVSSLVASGSGVNNVTDADGPGLGIALTGTAAGGTWYYSLDNGANWSAVGTVADNSALLLDGTARLYLDPTTDASGTINNAITFRAWDESNGGAANGTKVDTSSNGGSTPFSTATDTANITIDPVRIGNTFYATISDALAAAQAGDTIYIQPGTYNENVVVNKAGVTLQGVGAPGSVIIHGTFESHNVAAHGMTPGQPVNEFLANNGYDVSGVGDGITVSADNVTLSNLTVEDFDSAVKVTGPSVSGLTLQDMTLQHSVNGFLKPDDTALNGLTIDGSTISDTYIGVQFANDNAATGGAGFGKDATDTTITNTDFKDITVKGIYVETLQGTTLFDGITMDNVGQFGTGTGFGGTHGGSGNGIDLNLKYHTYTGDVTISNFTLTDTGASTGGGLFPTGHAGGGAIVLEARDDAGSYNTIPADASGLNINVENGTIDGTTSTAIRTGEPGKHNAGPAVTVGNVSIPITATVLQTEISNLTSAPMTVTGTDNADTIRDSQTPGYTGPVLLYGKGGDDYLVGGLGDDTLSGGAGDDVVDGSAGINTADYSDATEDGLVVDLSNQTLTAGTSSGGYGAFSNVDELHNIQNLTGSAFADTLIGDENDNVLRGGAGDDYLDGGAGGSDTADYSDATGNGLIVDLMNSASSGGGLGNDTLINIQNVSGSSFNDMLIGDDGDNILSGGDGNDILYGHGGTNQLLGGDGTDVAYYYGQESAYTVLGGPGAFVVGGGPEDVGNGGFDSASVERVKFLAPSHTSDLDNDATSFSPDAGKSELVYQGGNQVAVNGAVLTYDATGQRVVGTGQFNPDVNRNANILIQDNSTGELSVLVGPADTTTTGFNGAALTPGNYGADWKAVSTGDFNGDASWDVVLQNQVTHAVEVMTVNQNAGDGVGFVNSVAAVAAPAGANWNVVTAGDFNGDGKSDILWQNSASKAIDISLANSAGGFTLTPARSATGLTAVASGDFNGDGKSDILLKNGTGQAVVWFMDGSNRTGTKTITHPMDGFTWSVAGAADTDGNGYSDIIWTDTAAGQTSATMLGGPSSGVGTTVLLSNASQFTPGSGFNLIATGGG